MTVHDAARRGFEREAEAYERGRPAYPPQATAWLTAELGLGADRTVVDVGAGTGKLTRALVPSHALVIAVEPVAEMRRVLARELPGVTVLEGTAESLPLDDESADAIVAGQAFHWFDGPTALAEFHRVLRPRGRLGLIWNARDRRQPLQRAIDDLTEPLRGSTPSVGSGQWHAVFERSASFAPVGERKIPFELALDPDTFIDRIVSVSFVAALDDARRHDMLERVRELAAQHPEPWSYVAEAHVFARRGRLR
jgi:SAM-dependent methyltransferase